MTVAPPFTPAPGDLWWVIDDIGAVAAARRSAAALASDLRFDDDRVGEVGIVVSELATNLVRHAGGGELAVRVLCEGDDAALRIMAIDSGPGSRDIRALIPDGESTRHTLGIGLGACVRLSSCFDIYSVPAIGTIVESEMAVTLDDERPAPSARAASLTRPLSGEGPCGDTTAFFERPDGWLAMVADGLGHGPLAATASQRAAEVLASCRTDSPAAALQQIHMALTSTRGAAIALVAYDATAGALRHAGVGNIVVRVLGEGTDRSLASQPGIVGHRMPHVRETVEPVTRGATVVLHSDGLSQRWSLRDIPDVLLHRPAVVCAALMRSASTRRDDAGLLVARTVR